MKRKVSAPVILLVLGLAALSVSSAASLSLIKPRISTVAAADRCTVTAKVEPGPLTNGSTTSVVLSGLHPTCAQQRASMTLYNRQGAALVTVNNSNLGAVTNGKATLTVPKVEVASIEGAALTIGTWGISNTFIEPTEPLPLVSCSLDDRPDVKCEVVHDDIDRRGNDFRIEGVRLINRPKIEGATFTLTINLEDPALPQPIRHLESDMKLGAGMTCDSRPNIVFVGPDGDNVTNEDGKSSKFEISGSTKANAQTSTTKLFCP